MVPLLLQNMLIRSIYCLKRLPIQIKAPLVTIGCWRVAKCKNSFRLHQLSNKQTRNKHVSLCRHCWRINGCPYIKMYDYLSNDKIFEWSKQLLKLYYKLFTKHMHITINSVFWWWNGFPYKMHVFDEMQFVSQFVSHCYTVVSYQAIFRHSICKKISCISFQCKGCVFWQDTWIRFPDYDFVNWLTCRTLLFQRLIQLCRLYIIREYVNSFPWLQAC